MLEQSTFNEQTPNWIGFEFPNELHQVPSEMRKTIHLVKSKNKGNLFFEERYPWYLENILLSFFSGNERNQFQTGRREESCKYELFRYSAVNNKLNFSYNENIGPNFLFLFGLFQKLNGPWSRETRGPRTGWPVTLARP